jgi:hypothetical protein
MMYVSMLFASAAFVLAFSKPGHGDLVRPNPVGCEDSASAPSVEAYSYRDLLGFITAFNTAKDEFESFDDYRRRLSIISDSLCSKTVLMSMDIKPIYNAEKETFWFKPTFETNEILGKDDKYRKYYALVAYTRSLNDTQSDARLGQMQRRLFSQSALASLTNSDWSAFTEQVIKVPKTIAKKVSSEIEYIVLFKLSPEFQSDYDGRSVKMKNGNFYNSYLKINIIEDFDYANKRKATSMKSLIGVRPYGWVIRNSRTGEEYARGGRFAN